MATGRPTLYTPELGDKICELVATNDCGLNHLCANYDWMPDESTVRLWRFKHETFSLKYNQAKKFQAELYAESTHQLAAEKHYYYDAEGNQRVDTGHVAWQKMNVHLRQWHAAKLAPKLYGDQKQVEQLQGEKEQLQKEIEELRSGLAEKHKKDY